MKPNPVKLSVVMTSLDARVNLERCLPALAAQSFLDFEVVIALRGSLDGSLTVLEMLRRRLPFKLEVVALGRVSNSVARAIRKVAIGSSWTPARMAAATGAAWKAAAARPRCAASTPSARRRARQPCPRPDRLRRHAQHVVGAAPRRRCPGCTTTPQMAGNPH